MNTHVIILAQGTQARMGDAITTPKQLLTLHACGGAPIIGRTLAQLAVGWKALGDGYPYRISIVSWHETHQLLYAWWNASPARSWRFDPGQPIELEMTSLLSPGNSSLKGIHGYLEMLALTAGAERPERTVVLLGDVVYSWKCLETIFARQWAPHTRGNGMPRCRFVGSSDISPSGGELWGVMWERSSDTNTGMGRRGVIDALEAAVTNHPPFSAYQPGQLRRWMWQIHPSFHATTMYERIDDYTMDVDLPEHVPLLNNASAHAVRDDAEHGLIW